MERRQKRDIKTKQIYKPKKKCYPKKNTNSTQKRVLSEDQISTMHLQNMKPLHQEVKQ